ERNSEIAGLLAVITGEHTKSARINRERLVQRKLGGEVGDGPRALGIAVLPPRVACAPGGIEGVHRGVVDGQEAFVCRRPVLRSLVHLLQHLYGVVGSLAPKRVVQFAKTLPGLWIPRPPQIGGEFWKPLKPLGDDWGVQAVGSFFSPSVVVE